MIRFIAAALAALYLVALVFGAPSRRVDIPRGAPVAAHHFSLSDLLSPADTPAPEIKTGNSGITDAQAVAMAMAAGTAYRQTHGGQTTLVNAPAPAAQTPKPDAPAAQAETYWYVTASKVNLRAGPGTGNEVVGQLSHGDRAVVLEDRSGWYRVMTADGAVSGWILGRFLSEQKPG